ncbi:MAG: HlyD family efflux transporter periplasmic adaptor subunit [Acidobacteriota bacterium]
MSGRGRPRLAVKAAAALLGLLALGAVANLSFEEREGRWLEIERRDLVVRVDVEGELEAIESVRIGPPIVPMTWQYKISFLAPEGSEVEEGQPILAFDTKAQRQQLEQLESRRDTTHAELERTLADLRRERSALELQLSEAEAKLRKTEFLLKVPPELTSQRELRSSQIDRDLDRMEIDRLRGELEYLAQRQESDVSVLTRVRDQAAAQVETLQGSIAAMQIKAPRRGTVVLVGDWKGEKPKVGDQSWRGRNILEIPDLEAMRATVQVAEADLGRVQPGQRVTFRLDAYPDLEFVGEVSTLRRVVQPRSPADPRKVVEAQIALRDTDTERMRPGMRLRGQIEIERLPERVAVPEEAVFADADGSHVWVQTLTGRERRTPELGRRDANYFEVVEGLEIGELVLGRESS